MTNSWDISYDIDDLIEPENKNKNPFAKTFDEVTKKYDSLWDQVTDREPYEWLDDTEKQKYDLAFGHQKEAHIELMHPDKYLREWEFLAEKNPVMAKKIHERSQAKINTYKAAMEKGAKFPLPWLRYIDKGFVSQEGYHRVNAAKQLGIEKVPVVIMDIDKNRSPRMYSDDKKKQNPFTLESELV